jgi:hypothetical protein
LQVHSAYNATGRCGCDASGVIMDEVVQLAFAENGVIFYHMNAEGSETTTLFKASDSDMLYLIDNIRKLLEERYEKQVTHRFVVVPIQGLQDAQETLVRFPSKS